MVDRKVCTKPSERIHQIALRDAESTQGGRDRLLSTWGHPDIFIEHVMRYLDEEAERAKPKPVICPECTAAGTRSKIVKVHRGGATMGVYFAPKAVFDDDGREHNHDENRQSCRTGYECSNGHIFSMLSIAPCWCGWPERA